MSSFRLPHTQQIDTTLLWHPFTSASDARDFPPLVIRKAKGLHLWDDKGNKYLDTISSWWTNLHGHGHPSLVRAVARQARTLDHVNFSGFTHKPATELTQRLSEKLPAHLKRFFYSDNGSTAVEIALKMAFQFFANQGRNEKQAFAYLDGAYHGDTIGSVSVSGIDDFHSVFSPLRFKAYRLPSPIGLRSEGITGNPIPRKCPDEMWNCVEKILREKASELAAVIVEPLIMCVAGMQTYPADFLQRLQKLCRSLDILVIYDEVATGFGRTGSFFAIDQSNTQPDFLCLAKGLSGGILPLALTITTERIYEAFDGALSRTFFHGHSYTANPIACAAGIASLKIFEQEKTLEKGQETRALFAQKLTEFAREAGIDDARFLGLMGAVDLVDPHNGKVLHANVRAGRRVYQKSLEKGLVLRPLGDTIYWFLPLCTKPKDVQTILSRSFEVIREVLSTLPPHSARESTAPVGRDV